jgi:THUMP domain-like
LVVLDLNLLSLLRTPQGQAALRAAADLEPTEATFLRASQQLARTYPEQLARAATEQAILRGRARSKFRAAAGMFFLRDALEQATNEVVAAHRARRFGGAPWTFDLGCGIGGDALALATVSRVVAIDREALRLAVLAANVQVQGTAGSVLPVQADLRHAAWRPPRAALAFCDPSRRAGGRRFRSTLASEPPLRVVLDLVNAFDGSAVKVSPAVDRDEITGLGCEVEFVSHEGDLKEATLWLGTLRTAARRATVLPGGASLAGEVEPEIEVRGLEGYLYEPDPAVLRAELVHTLAAEMGAHLIDRDLAFLSSPKRIDTPFARRYCIEDVLPFGLKRLQAALRARRVGVLTLKKRGSPVDTEALQGRLRLEGEAEATVILTRADGRRVAVLVRRDVGDEIAGDERGVVDRPPE